MGSRMELWREHVSAQQEGGMSVPAYCRENGLSEGSFYKWRQRFSSEPRRSSFEEVTVSDHSNDNKIMVDLLTLDHETVCIVLRALLAKNHA